MKNYTEMTKDELEKELNLFQQTASIRLDEEQNRSRAAVDELQRLRRDLQAQQIELELRNRELREAREQLEEARNRSADLYDLAPYGYLTLDDKGYIKEINLTGARLLGQERSSLVGTQFVAYVADGEDSRFLEYVRRCRQGEEKVMTELTLRGDSARQVQVVSTLTCDKAQRSEFCRAALIDITERRQAEMALRESQSRLSAIIDSAMDAIITVDADQRITVFNGAAAQMFGCSGEEAIGKSINCFIPGRFIGAHREHVNVFGRANVTQRSMGTLGVVYGLRANGEEFPIEASISRIDAGGRKYFTVILRDITKRQQAEEELRQERDKAQQYLDVVEVMVVVLGKEGEIRQINRKGCEVLEYQERELVGSSWFDVCVPAEEHQFVQTVFRRVATGDTEPDEYVENKVLTKSGKQRLIRWHNAALTDAAGNLTGTLSSGEDITEKKQLEAQFLRVQRLESLGTLAGGIAHDLNNILSPVLIGVQMLQMELADTTNQHWLEIIRSNVERGADLVKQILLFASGGPGELVPLQPKHLIREIAKILGETFPKSIEIKLSIPDKLALVSGDATQLHQLLMNLCVNARDAMPNGGRLSIEAANVIIDEQHAAFSPDARPGQYVQFAISDTGTGVPEAIKDKIFDPFFTTKELGKGTGLGLSIVLGIVKNHDGFINVYSDAGRGTKFAVYLRAHTAGETLHPAVNRAEMPAGCGELILVVDDEAAVREITCATLETFGYKVLTASDGTEALTLYAQHGSEIQAVLIDLLMPYMDGTTTIRALQKLNPQIRVMASSGLTRQEKVNQLAALGVKHFLAKPYAADQLLKMLAQLLSDN